MVRSSVIGFAVLVLGSCLGMAGGEKSKSPVKVDVEWDKEERADVVDVEGALDMTPRLQLRATGVNFSVFVSDDTGKRLDLGHLAVFKIDGKVVAPSAVLTPDGRTGIIKKDTLPKKGGKERVGYSKVWTSGDLQITQTVELVQGRTTGEVRKRQMDAVLIRHTIENKGKAAHSVGMRTLIDERSGKVGSATKPGAALDGVEFKGSALPPYLKVQQMEGKKAKGKLAALAPETYITLAAAGGERPDRLVVSGGPRTDPWELPVMAGGPLPAVALFWEPKEIAPGGKRELVYGYGTSVASTSGGDVSFRLDLAGSFEPGKTFTLSAIISDPSPGQSLELDLPKGLELREGKAIQPVPTALGETSGSVILWKARVLEFGRFPIRIRSGAGVTRTVIVTVGPA